MGDGVITHIDRKRQGIPNETDAPTRAPASTKRRPAPKATPATTAKAAAAAIIECKGLVTHAAQRLGIKPRVLRSYIYRFPLVSEALKEARQRTGDLCESKLYNAIEAGESWAIRFYATTQMRDRGYGDKPAGVDTGGAVKVEQPPTPKIDYDAYNRAYEEAMDAIRDKQFDTDGPRPRNTDGDD